MDTGSTWCILNPEMVAFLSGSFEETYAPSVPLLIRGTHRVRTEWPLNSLVLNNGGDSSGDLFHHSGGDTANRADEALKIHPSQLEYVYRRWFFEVIRLIGIKPDVPEVRRVAILPIGQGCHQFDRQPTNRIRAYNNGRADLLDLRAQCWIKVDKPNSPTAWCHDVIVQ